jgi:hypothetical protein
MTKYLESEIKDETKYEIVNNVKILNPAYMDQNDKNLYKKQYRRYVGKPAKPCGKPMSFESAIY